MTHEPSTLRRTDPAPSATQTGGRAGARPPESDHRSVVRIEARGTEPAAVVHEVGGLYDGKDWAARPTDRPFTYRYTALGDERVTLRRSRITGAIRGAIPHTDDYVLQWITEGQAVPDVRRDRVPLAVGVPMLFPSAREFVFEYRDYDQRLVHLSRDLVHEVAEERFHTLPTSDLGLDHLRRLDPVALVRWRAQMALLADELRSGVGTLLWQNLTRSAASAFLDLYPPSAASVPAPLLSPRRARILAAVEYVHAHAAEPVTVSDVARAGGLSVRSVQEGFLRDLGTTPMAYLLQVRLRHVRDELRSADPGTTTVQEVARRWGFAHLGRFSASYARAFDEYPRETLRR